MLGTSTSAAHCSARPRREAINNRLACGAGRGDTRVNFEEIVEKYASKRGKIQPLLRKKEAGLEMVVISTALAERK